MLFLTRKKDSLTFIGDDIKILVASCGPRSVMLGFDAPKNLRILRDELDGRSFPPKPGPSLESVAVALCLRLQAEMTPLPSGLPHPLADAYRTAQILVRQLAGAAGEKARAS